MPNGIAAASSGRRPLKVLYDFVIFRMERRGGISRYITELAARLGRSGEVDATILGGVHDNDFLADRAATSGARLIGVRTRHACARTAVVGALDYAALHAYHRFGGRTDVYHPTYYPRSLGRPRGARIVATVYDMIHERLPEYHAGDPTPARKRALVHAADLILCISETTANDLTKYYGVDRGRICVTYLGASVTPRSEQRQPDDAVPTRPYFLHVGRRAGYKNFRMLLEAYVSDHALATETAICAVGGGGWSDDERALIDRAVPGALLIQRDATDSQLADLYRNAIALVVPSLYEGFGLPAVEAMQAGCPVIANAVGSLPEVIGDAGIVRALADPAAIGGAMRDVFESSALSDRLKACGVLRAAQFDWSRTAHETLAAYRRVVGED